MPAGVVVFSGMMVPRTSVVISPDSKTLLVAGLHHSISKVPVSSWWRFWNITPATEESYPVARLWRLRDGKQLAAFRGCETGLFSSDSKTLAAMYDDGTIRIWDVPPRKPLLTVLGMAFAVWLAILATLRVVRWHRIRRSTRAV